MANGAREQTSPSLRVVGAEALIGQGGDGRTNKQTGKVRFRHGLHEKYDFIVRDMKDRSEA